MRLLLITTGMSGGGAESHFRLIAPLVGQAAECKVVVALLQQSFGGPEGVVGLGWRSILDYPAAIWRLRRIMSENDIDTVFSFSRSVNFVAWVAAFLSPGKPVMIAGVVSQIQRAFQVTPSMANRIWFRWERFAYPRFNGVLCNSADAARELVELIGCDPARVRVMRNPVTLPDRLQRYVAEGPIVSVGRLARGKGFEDLIDAYAAGRLQAVRKLQIVGAGPLGPSLRQRCADRGVAANTEFVGWQEDVRPFLRAAAVFVSASYSEGLPNAVLEAFAQGVPVVATRSTSWIAEFADQGALIMVEPGEVGCLADAVVRVCSDRQLAEELRVKAWRVVGEFRPDMAASDVDAALRQFGTELKPRMAV